MKYGNVLVKIPKNKLTMQIVDIYPPNDLVTQMLTGEHEIETEEEMEARIEAEEDFSSSNDED